VRHTIQPNSRALPTAAVEARAQNVDRAGVVTVSLIELGVQHEMRRVGVLLIGDGEIGSRHRHDDAVALNLDAKVTYHLV